jgi:hypothetical protein
VVLVVAGSDDGLRRDQQSGCRTRAPDRRAS